MDEKTFTVIDENGKEIEYEVVLTFKNDEFNKSYVIYKLPGDDVDEVTAAIYDDQNTVIKQFTDGLPGRVSFLMRDSSSFFELEVPARLIQNIALHN